MGSHNLSALLAICPPEFVPFLRLYLVFEELKGPNDPECSRGHEASGEELPVLRVHERSMTSAQIQHANKASQEADIPE